MGWGLFDELDPVPCLRGSGRIIAVEQTQGLFRVVGNPTGAGYHREVKKLGSLHVLDPHLGSGGGFSALDGTEGANGSEELRVDIITGTGILDIAVKDKHPRPQVNNRDTFHAASLGGLGDAGVTDKAILFQLAFGKKVFKIT